MVPFTFLAHQAPVMPLVARRGGGWDGVALVMGTIAPDLAYVTVGWGYGPWGIPLWFEGHRLAHVPTVAALACVLTLVVRRVVLPVAPLLLPDSGPWHLRDLWYLSRSRSAWWVTAGSAVVGVLTHLALDAFTHGYPGAWLAQITLTLVGIAVTLRYLRRIGQRRLWRRPAIEPPTLVPSQRMSVLVGIVAGVIGGVIYAVHRSGTHRVVGIEITATTSVVLMSFTWVALAGLTAGCLAARLLSRTFHLAERRSFGYGARNRRSTTQGA